MLVRPDTKSELLRSKLSRGLGHNSYGEQAWPNDLLYMFPISILGIFSGTISLAILAPTPVGEPANPYATPYEILPEWFLFPTFQILKVGVLCWGPVGDFDPIHMALFDYGRGPRMWGPGLEPQSRFQNPIRRPEAKWRILRPAVIFIFLGRNAPWALEILAPHKSRGVDAKPLA
jgi:cytochrome b6-f complex subunit 4